MTFLLIKAKKNKKLVTCKTTDI